MTEYQRLERSICTLTEELERISRLNEKHEKLIIEVGTVLNKNWGSHKDRLPSCIAEIINEAERLEVRE
jgi:hypothetical protein